MKKKLNYPHVDRETLKNFVDESLPVSLPEEILIRKYIDRDCPQGELIYLSFGETWTEAPDELIALSKEPVSKSIHGYVLNQYGLPQLQRALRAYLPTDHRLPSDFHLGRDFEIAVASSGTRASMFDFGRMLKDDVFVGKTPVVIASLPGWDYTSIFESLGYKISYLPLRRENNFHPHLSDLEAALSNIEASKGECLAMIAINAQHNPTGVNWSEQFIRTCIQTAIRQKAGILIDDAYYAMHDPHLTPNSALQILAEELKKEPADSVAHKRWIGVRSLGKQFHCNGWGVGSAMAHPETLNRLITYYLNSRTYVYAGLQQLALARWLNTQGSKSYLDMKNKEYEEKRKEVSKLFESVLGYPKDAYFVGECTSYILFQIPDRFVNRLLQKPDGSREKMSFSFENDFRAEILEKSGVLLGSSSLALSDEVYSFNKPHLRIFLGPKKEALREALDRLKATGYSWN
ncbi:MAG: aminotransferase class I/II-fold pyridoxal phosphate-dependent enzyme [Oligoflexales bacterium]|nr:aminotransferase class I/II-fold pyridoxal phosphate-dependent enzyme [Oligoflexales bacterium]